jgi:hypothetical protein
MNPQFEKTEFGAESDWLKSYVAVIEAGLSPAWH